MSSANRYGLTRSRSSVTRSRVSGAEVGNAQPSPWGASLNRASGPAAPAWACSAFSAAISAAPVVQLERFAQGPHHGRVGRYPAQQGDRRLRNPTSDHGGFVVGGHRVAQAAQHLRRAEALLLGVDHVTLGKNAAATGDLRRPGGALHDRPDVLDGILQSRSLLIEERSGARGAVPVGAVIEDAQSPATGVRFEANVLAGLAADLKDGANLVMEQVHGPGGGLEIVIARQVQGLGDQFAARTGQSDRGNRLTVEVFGQFSQDFAGRFEWSATRASWPGDQHGPVVCSGRGQQPQKLPAAASVENRIDQRFGEYQRSLGADRAHIDAQVNTHLLLRPRRSRATPDVSAIRSSKDDKNQFITTEPLSVNESQDALGAEALRCERTVNLSRRERRRRLLW